ncbi:MAG TPA: hypothetical protein P5235_09780 [Saprospiraceae bacterium]|nr:hypothetical protein [Saprospiraceae bacterium]
MLKCSLHIPPKTPLPFKSLSEYGKAYEDQTVTGHGAGQPEGTGVGMGTYLSQ